MHKDVRASGPVPEESQWRGMTEWMQKGPNLPSCCELFELAALPRGFGCETSDRQRKMSRRRCG
jgi:hypothetical protein